MNLLSWISCSCLGILLGALLEKRPSGLVKLVPPGVHIWGSGTTRSDLGSNRRDTAWVIVPEE